MVENTPCNHTPLCPTAGSPDREAARVISSHPEQGWSLLCNGSVLFEDTGELLPDGRVIAPHRPTPPPALPSTAGSQVAPGPFRFADTSRLIGGTPGSGKTSAAAAMHRFALASDPVRPDARAQHPSV
ncbi:hypothetical protein F3K30_43445 [Streptomyces sp. LBUM 1487]|nr:hypothetical protein [Streptomyces sp. LBUM 1487]